MPQSGWDLSTNNLRDEKREDEREEEEKKK
jgi:hypothetical protein